MAIPTADAAARVPNGGTLNAVAAAGVRLAIQSVVEPALAPLPHVEIKSPFAGQHIRAAKAAGYRVRLEVEHWPVTGVELMLDDFRPRRLETLDSPVHLGDLVPADRELDAGEHLLVAIAVRTDGVTVKPGDKSLLEPFGTVHFRVGPRGRSSIDMKAPMLFESQPRGTYNGVAAADDVLLDFYLLGARLGPGEDSVAASISGRGVDEKLVIRDWHARRVRGLPSGDYRVELQLRGADDKPLVGLHVRAVRTITVNRDAALGGGKP